MEGTGADREEAPLVTLFFEKGRDAMEVAAEGPYQAVQTYLDAVGDSPGAKSEDLAWATGLLPEISGDEETDEASGACSEQWSEARIALAGYWFELGEERRGFELLRDAVRYEDPNSAYDNEHLLGVLELFGNWEDLFERVLDSYERETAKPT